LWYDPRYQPREELVVVSTVALEKLQSAYRHWNSDKGSTAEPLFDLMSDDLTFRSIAGGAPDMAFTRPHSNKDQVKATSLSSRATGR